MLHSRFHRCWLTLAFCLLGVGYIHADGKKGDLKPQEGKSARPQEGKIVLVIDASKLPPGLLRQLLAYAEKSSAEKKSEAPAKRPDKDGKTEAKKPNIVQVDLNKLSPELAKRLQAELAHSKAKKQDDRRPGKANKDDKGKRGKKHDDD